MIEKMNKVYGLCGLKVVSPKRFFGYMAICVVINAVCTYWQMKKAYGAL